MPYKPSSMVCESEDVCEGVGVSVKIDLVLDKLW